MSVLEVGCGFGRITEILTDTFIIGKYVALDISKDQLSHVHVNHPEDAEAPELELIEADFMEWNPHRKFDLVIAVEFLMHQLPSQVQIIVDKMIRLSNEHIISLDYFHDGEELEPHNFNHNYPYLYGYKAKRLSLGKQSIFHYQK